MTIIFTNHARKRMIERGVKENQVIESIELPDYTISKEDKIEVYKKINNRVLKIIYIKSDNFIKIISVMWR